MAVFTTWSVQTECAIQNPNGTWASKSNVFVQLSGLSVTLGTTAWSLSATIAKKPKTTRKGLVPRSRLSRVNKKVADTPITQRAACTSCQVKRRHEQLEDTQNRKRARMGEFTDVVEQTRRRWDPEGMKKKEDWKRMIRLQRERVKLAEMMLVDSAMDEVGTMSGCDNSTKELAGTVDAGMVGVSLIEEAPMMALDNTILWTGMEELFNIGLSDVLGSGLSVDGTVERASEGENMDWMSIEMDKWLSPTHVYT